MKNKILEDFIKIMGLYLFVFVVIMVKYDLIINIDVIDGFINGVECMIENIDYRVENFIRLSIIWVLFLYFEIGKKLCREYVYLYKRSINKNWILVLEVIR